MLCELLRAHFALEDEICFPALHGLAPDSLARLERPSTDHRELLAELDRLIDDPDAADAVLRFGAALRAHERREAGLLNALLADDGPAQ